MAEPTDQDRENARVRAQIAAAQNAEYAEAERLALGRLGPGWRPWMKIVLLDSDYHRSGKTEPAAVAFKVYRGERRLSENSVYLRRMPDGQVLVAPTYEALFPELHDVHPTRKLEVGGEMVPAPQWSLCWAALERYEPLDASRLAALRASRETRKAAREEAKFRRENPLLAWAEREIREAEGRGR